MNYDPQIHRTACAVHILRRCADRGLRLTAEDIARLEDLASRTQSLFERPGVDRYWLRIRTGKAGLVSLLYDIQLACAVTIFPARRNWHRHPESDAELADA